jgi:hypothetical protein
MKYPNGPFSRLFSCRGFYGEMARGAVNKNAGLFQTGINWKMVDTSPAGKVNFTYAPDAEGGIGGDDTQFTGNPLAEMVLSEPHVTAKSPECTQRRAFNTPPDTDAENKT